MSSSCVPPQMRLSAGGLSTQRNSLDESSAVGRLRREARPRIATQSGDHIAGRGLADTGQFGFVGEQLALHEVKAHDPADQVVTVVTDQNGEVGHPRRGDRRRPGQRQRVRSARGAGDEQVEFGLDEPEQVLAPGAFRDHLAAELPRGLEASWRSVRRGGHAAVIDSLTCALDAGSPVRCSPRRNCVLSRCRPARICRGWVWWGRGGGFGWQFRAGNSAWIAYETPIRPTMPGCAPNVPAQTLAGA